MKSQLALRFLILLLLLSVYRAGAQQNNISVSGKITNLEDGQPIHSVSVSIFRKGVGTATNAAGMFALIIPAGNVNDTLKISCIGFKTKQLPINSLKGGDVLNLTLEKNMTLLKEVYIGPAALKVIQKAISRIPDNYINHPHIIRGFYRMYTFNKDVPLELSEAVFDVYNFGYADKRADLFRLIKARSEKNEHDFSALELGQKPNSVFEDDVVNHLFTSGFLSEDGMENHDYEVKGIVDIKGYQAYQIEFKEKKPLEDATFRGTMFIDTKTFAFIYFDYGLSPNSLKDLGDGRFAKQALMKAADITLDLTEDHYTVSYQEVGSKWVLAAVEGNHTLNVGIPDVGHDYAAHIKFNYQVTAVDTTQTASFNSKIGRNENISEHDSDAGEKFWKDYNILLSDFNTEDIFKQIIAINKAVKVK